MNMLHRFVLLFLVLAAFVQPAFAAAPVVTFELDDSTNVSAYEETLPTGEVPEAPEIPAPQAKPEPTKPAVPPAKPAPKPVSANAPKPAPRDIPLIEMANDQMASPEVRYITGGIGEDEINEMMASKPEYNVYVMSANASGAFVGDARVVISRKQAEVMEVVLDVISGPLLYVSLPAGSYTLSATLGAQSKRQAFVMKEKGAVRSVHLGWK